MMSNTDETQLLNFTRPHETSGWIWVQSDLQLDKPAEAERVLSRAVADMATLNGKEFSISGIWCLGDVLCGSNEEDLHEVALDCIEKLETFSVPVAYVLGNHEMDVRSGKGRAVYPLYEYARKRPLWHVQENLEDPWFERRCFGLRVIFFGDHAQSGAEGWYVQHHGIRSKGYPYKDAWTELHKTMQMLREPLLTASHYAFPGGQRPGELMQKLIPLPASVITHLYGHAHIGDMVWNGERPYQRCNPITASDTLQYNISALEDVRSPGSHSALLYIENSIPRLLRIRCHQKKEWIEEFSL